MAGQKKLQTAIEYLVNYGWAILAIVVVIAVLTYELGGFSGGSYAASACLAQAGLSCQNPVMNTSNYLGVNISSFGTTYSVSGIACTSSKQTPSSFAPLSRALIISATPERVAFQCPSELPSGINTTIGSAFTGYLWIEYSTSSQSGQIMQLATISASASTSGPVAPGVSNLGLMYLLTGSKILVLDPNTYNVVYTLNLPYTTIAFTPNGEYAFATSGQTVHVLSVQQDYKDVNDFTPGYPDLPAIFIPGTFAFIAAGNGAYVGRAGAYVVYASNSVLVDNQTGLYSIQAWGLTPDGMYVITIGQTSGLEFDTQTASVRSMGSGWYAGNAGLGISPDSSHAYIGLNTNKVIDINIATATQAGVINLPTSIYCGCLDPTVGQDGEYVYIPAQGTQNIMVASTSTDTFVQNISTGSTGVYGLIAVPGSDKLYGTSPYLYNAPVINTVSNTKVGTLPVGISQNSYAWKGGDLYVGTSTGFDIINASTDSLVGSVNLGVSYPNIVFAP